MYLFKSKNLDYKMHKYSLVNGKANFKISRYNYTTNVDN